MLLNKREDVGFKHRNDSKAFIGCSNDIDDIYENNRKYNPRIIKLRQIVAELLFGGRKPNISLIFTIQSDFAVPKSIRLKSLCLILKASNKQELQ